jgi:type IV pilus assembly protein PilF
MPLAARTRIAVIAAALLAAACASKGPVAPPPQPELPAVKTQEATPAQRAQIRVELAAGYYERGKMEVALEELGEAVRLDPSNARIYNIYGLVYTMMGEKAKAEENFRRAVQMAPTDSEILHNWGAFLCTTGRGQEGIVEFEKALADPLYRHPEVALINAGKCSASLGEYARAEQFFHRALTASPGNPIAAYNLARLAFREHKLDLARTWMKPVMQQQNPSPEALYLGMCIERKHGDRQAELSYASQLRNRFPDSAEAKALTGGVCE